LECVEIIINKLNVANIFAEIENVDKNLDKVAPVIKPLENIYLLGWIALQNIRLK
tara:strand:+ start:51628 stop:51792 length:165 start_codon:yes stop_codon:yes gene_type:complete